MKANMLAVVAICALAGVMVSCIAPHAMLGPLDFPQVVHGKVQWSTTDGHSYDIQFDANDSPCSKKEGALLHVVPGKVTTCTVVGTGLFYPYTITQPSLGKLATITAHRAVIVPCRACGEFLAKQKHADGSRASVGAVVALGAGPTTFVVESQCPPGDPNPNDVCLYQGQVVEWQLSGSGTQLEVDFPAGNTACSGNTIQLMGSTSSPGSLPLACTTVTGATNPVTYKYTFKVNGGGTLDNNSTVTVMKAP